MASNEFAEPDPRNMDYVDGIESQKDDALTFVSEEDIKNLKLEQEVTDESMVSMGQRFFEDNLPQAVLSIVKVARHSENDKLRFDAAKYIVERVLGKIQDTGTTEKAAWEKLIDETTTVIPGVTN